MRAARGHDGVWRQFDAAWRRGRLGQAYLFAGPPGVGKALFARDLANAILCEAKGEALAACGTCPGCRQFAAGAHPDFRVDRRPDDKLEVPVELVRDLCEHLRLKPARGPRKVAVLEDADDLNDASANCFLKSLEEPPPGSTLILIGTDPARQLPTIVSRCQVIRFAPLPAPLVAEILRESGVADARQVEQLARLGGGSPGAALELNEPEVWAFRDRLAAGLAEPTPDFIGLAKEWNHFAEEAGKEAAAQRRRAALVLRLLIGLLRDAVRSSLGDGPPTGLTRLGVDRLLRWVDRCLEADRHFDRRVQVVLVLEALLDALGRDHPSMMTATR